jgi:hypothetical protein
MAKKYKRINPAKGKSGDWKQIIIAAAVFIIILQAVSYSERLLNTSYYNNPIYSSLWSPLVVQTGTFDAVLVVSMIIANMLIGIIFAYGYSALGNVIPGKALSKGVNYGLFIFMLAGIPFILEAFLVFAVPVPLLAGWAIGGIITCVLGGAAFARIITI